MATKKAATTKPASKAPSKAAKPAATSAKPAKTPPIWDEVLALSTFNTEEGRVVQQKARAKLRALPAGLDVDVARRIFDFYAREACYELWPISAKLPDTLADAYVASFKHVQVDYLEQHVLRDAYKLGGTDGLHEMGALIAFASSGTNTPALLKRVDEKKSAFDTKTVRAVARDTLEKLTYERASLSILVHAILLWIVLQAKDTPAPLVKAIEASMTSWDAAGKGYEPGSNAAFFARIAKAARADT